MKKSAVLFIAYWLLMWAFIAPLSWADAPENPKTGEFKGAKDAEHPDWFKASFLDFEEDIAEATEAGKRLVVYFWQPGCPYCAKLWSDNFASAETERYFRQHFDIVAINLWGDREVVSIGGDDYTEKSLAAALRIQYTPTLLFFNEQQTVALRLNGYIPPDNFRLALEFVAEKHDVNMSYAQFMADRKVELDKQARQKNNSSQSNPTVLPSGLMKLFKQPPVSLTNSKKNNNSTDKQYTAVLFDSDACEACQQWYEKSLGKEVSLDLLKQFNTIRVDRYSKKESITLGDKMLSPKAWYESLALSYLPAMVLFDENFKEVARIDSHMRTFHTQSVFDYVLSGAYKTETNFQKYISVRAEKIQHQGQDVDIWAD